MTEEMDMEEKPPKKKRDNTVFLLIVIMLLIVGIVVLWVVKDSEIYRTFVPVCTSDRVVIDLGEPESPSIFADLTQKELTDALELLEHRTGLNLKNGSDATVDSSYVFSIEVLIPKKSEALAFLDKSKSRPGRYARAIVFRGDIAYRVAEEYQIGPLLSKNSSDVTIVGMTRSTPWAVRPVSSIELSAMERVILPLLDKKVGHVLTESFGGKFINCSRRCLTYYYSPVSTSNYKVLTRNIWLHFTHAVEFHTLHPLEFHVLVNLDARHPKDFEIVEVSYNKQTYHSLDEFVRAFDKGTDIHKIHIQFPEVNNDLYSTLNLRGDTFPKEPSRPPFQLEPDGKRYMISGQKVTFLVWTFHYRMSTSSGPMLFDVRFQRERIAYEVSLQEIAALSIGKIPTGQRNNFEPQSGLLGTASRGLVPGADCPEHSTFLPARHLVEGSKISTVYQNALCVFEHETGEPLRRHHSYAKNSGKLYGGMLDAVLVLRTILSVFNYDYLIEFVFHLNGVLEVKVAYTGFMLARYSFNSNKQSGYQIQDQIVSKLQFHSFNFKLDMDVRGKKNSFSAIEPLTASEQKAADSNSTGIRFKTSIKSTERNAAYGPQTEMPKYLLFYNEKSTNKYKTPRAYSLHISENGKSHLPDNIGNMDSVSWLRYKLAVTKYRESEIRSSSKYSPWDGLRPIVTFDNFINNENIENQDLVAWVTLSTYHIPHTEDLPTMATVGTHLGFSLSPHNYFAEDPSMSSRNAIRVDMTGQTNNAKNAVRVERYAVRNDVRCVGNATDFYDLVAEDSQLLFVGDES